jgi:hypothetical protein
MPCHYHPPKTNPTKKPYASPSSPSTINLEYAVTSPSQPEESERGLSAAPSSCCPKYLKRDPSATMKFSASFVLGFVKVLNCFPRLFSPCTASGSFRPSSARQSPKPPLSRICSRDLGHGSGQRRRDGYSEEKVSTEALHISLGKV